MERKLAPSRAAAGWLIASALLAGCSATSSDLSGSFETNDGSTLTTYPGQRLEEVWFYGKWDLDGKRTSTANGEGGLLAAPVDLYRDLLGPGWKFEPYQVFKVDRTLGYETGSWRFAAPDQLVVHQPDGGQATYTARFQDGYLYLRDAQGRGMVFERNKFFGF